MEGAERFDDPNRDGEGGAVADGAVEFGPVDGGEDPSAVTLPGGGDPAELGDRLHEEDRRIPRLAAGDPQFGRGRDPRLQGDDPVEEEEGGTVGEICGRIGATQGSLR